MNRWVDRLVHDTRDRESAAALRQLFTLWQNNTRQVLALSAGNYQLRDIAPVARQVDRLASIGLRLTDLLARQGALDEPEKVSIQRELDSAAKVQDEVVIAAVYPLESLLRAAAK